MTIPNLKNCLIYKIKFKQQNRSVEKMFDLSYVQFH